MHAYIDTYACIQVGRGGEDSMEDIAGIEPQTTRFNDVFEFSVDPHNPTGALSETITVTPGDTDSRASVAYGDALTTSTAGLAASYWITARDSFENKRPGTPCFCIVLCLHVYAYGAAWDVLLLYCHVFTCVCIRSSLVCRAFVS
jgi:hypothetical protein